MLSDQDIIRTIASELGLKPFQAESTVTLLREGATVPFIARYRKERTGELDEVRLRQVRDRWAYLSELEERKASILSTLSQAGKLTGELEEKIAACRVKQELEDLYLPYRPKRRTRAAMAREKGLEPLALALWKQDESIDPVVRARTFLSAEKGVASEEEALDGARAIVAEIIADDPAVRKTLRAMTMEKGDLSARAKKGAAGQKTKFEDYVDYREPLRRVPSHRFLAVMRGESEGVLAVKIEAPEGEIHGWLGGRFIRGPGLAQHAFLAEALTAAYERHLAPSLASELLAELKRRSDEEAIRVFAENLRHLLLAPPAAGRVVLGVDPGLRTGCKLAVVDATGKVLETATIHPHPPQARTREAGRTVADLAARHRVEIAAVGNGTASRETEDFLRTLTKTAQAAAFHVVVVSEAGASVYSASDLARQELPGFDVTLRGAVSIARRLQDPLAELVKIDPRSIGVGQYQHDVDQPMLHRALQEEVESCVNFVGVDLNTASAQLLRHVSGLTESLAAAVVRHRDENGRFGDRRELLDVKRLGPKAFEQAAGFLRIRGGRQPLDDSAVHPESYGVVDGMARDLGVSIGDLVGSEACLEKIDPARYVTDAVGLATVRDILAELRKPGRDPRETFEPFAFAEGVTEIGHLREGMVLDGVVTNVTAFGAFVNVGVHQDGLVHVSQLSSSFVRDPRHVVRVGQRVKVKVLGVDGERRRISLSMKGTG
jgi:uncharacterized protein